MARAARALLALLLLTPGLALAANGPLQFPPPPSYPGGGHPAASQPAPAPSTPPGDAYIAFGVTGRSITHLPTVTVMAGVDKLPLVPLLGARLTLSSHNLTDNTIGIDATLGLGTALRLYVGGGPRFGYLPGDYTQSQTFMGVLAGVRLNLSGHFQTQVEMHADSPTTIIRPVISSSVTLLYH